MSQLTARDPRQEGEPWPGALGRIQRERRQLSETRRYRVLGYEDLAVKLTAAPLDFTAPDRWSGYVPPRMWAEQLNDSPQRAALVEICAEAAKRAVAENGAE